MEKSELIAVCNYYKGEAACPAAIEKAGKSKEWFIEKYWVDKGGKYDDNGEYEYADLLDFAKSDSVPLPLKKLLFNRYIQGVSLETAAPGFKVYYHEFYSTIDTDFAAYYQSLENL